MAPNLAPSTLEFIRDMILSNELTRSEIANAAGCHPPIMVRALRDHLLEKPHLYLDEMVIFIWDEFQVEVTTCSISRALKREGWSKKAAKYKARERNADLRDAYFHFISDFRSYHLVYVDESVTRG
jgi:hypothetical protein